MQINKKCGGKGKKGKGTKKFGLLLASGTIGFVGLTGCFEIKKAKEKDLSLIEEVPLFAGVEAGRETGIEESSAVGAGAIEALREGLTGRIPCGRQDSTDGFKVGFVWKPKSDGAFKGAVAVLPERFFGQCKELTITEKMKGKDKISKLRNKGSLEGREVFILDGREGASLKKNIRLSCGCRYWIINDPANRVD